MKDFKKPGGFGGQRGGSFGRSNGPRPSYNNRGRDDGFGRSEMYEAVCANCSNKCEVPFRPNGQKPVYCRDCFGKMGGASAGGGDRFAKREFTPRPSTRPSFENRPQMSSDQTTRQLEAVNAKLERLISVVERLVSGNSAPKAETKPKEMPKVEAPAVATPKKVSKKKPSKK